MAKDSGGGGGYGLSVSTAAQSGAANSGATSYEIGGSKTVLKVVYAFAAVLGVAVLVGGLVWLRKNR